MARIVFLSPQRRHIGDDHGCSPESDQDVDRPDGLALIVPAGIGRGFEYALSEDLPQEWRVYAMPIHDLLTAS